MFDMDAGTPPAAGRYFSDTPPAAPQVVRRLFASSPPHTPPAVARRLFATSSSSDTPAAPPHVARRLFATSSSSDTSPAPPLEICYSPPPEALARRLTPRRLFDSPPPARCQQQIIRLPAPVPLRQRFDTPPPRTRTYCPEFEPSTLKWNSKAITAYFSNYAPKYFR